MSSIESLESISSRIEEDLQTQGWSFMSTGVNPEDRMHVHALFEALHSKISQDVSIMPETTTLAPRDNSRVLATTREAMSYHTDNAYLDDPCRSVALFCTVQAETGGGNTLVDGLRVAKTMPDDVMEALKKEEWQWMNPVSDGPSNEYSVIDASEEAVRWWRMSLLPKNMAQVAVADVFEDAIQHSVDSKHVRMQPGDILVTDNTRIVHNREAFSGSRHLYRARFW